jgi:hypothetical protein
MSRFAIKSTLLFSLLGCICFGSVLTHAQEIVLAFEDTLAGSTSLDGTARSKMLINNMARADVKQAMFLIRGKTITAKTIDRLEYYNQTGQLLVNAGYNYSMQLRQKSYAYPIDIMKANAALESYENYHKHISFPYLQGNSDPELLAQLKSFLVEHNYLPTYITTRVHDEYMNHLYQLRIKDGRAVPIRQLEKAYVNMIMDAVLTYDGKAHMVLGSSPRQVLLLHENDLSAYCIIGLIDELNAKGFNIIAPEKVFADPVVNPYFTSRFSSTNYKIYISGISESTDNWVSVASKTDQEKIHRYLREQALDGLIPQ